jgi:hypothetical protein
MRDIFDFAGKLVLIFAFRVHRKPSFADALTLFEDLANAPKRREGKDAQEDGDIRVIHQQRAACRQDSDNEKRPPGLDTEIVLRLNDQRVKDTDTQERTCTEKNAFKIHC